MTGHLAAVVFEVIAVGFLVAVILTVRKARARGKRLFVDEPTARVKALHQVTSHDHELDGWY
jgi:ABC-type hemin transport system ATPase subunit